MVSTPSAPDPTETAQAQSEYNTNTAISQSLLNQINQVNPYGSVTYSQTGTNTFTGADGKTYTLPQYTQTTSLTPEGQAIQDNVMDAQTSLSQTAANQANAVSDTLSNPFSFTNDDASNWAYNLASKTILPQQQQATSDLKSQLVNSGLRPGTAAYDRAMTNLQQSQGQQLDTLALNGQQQAYNQALTTYNEPLNALNGLLSQSQVTNPGTASSATPTTSVAGVDYSGLVNSSYQNQLASSQSSLGGLFGLAGTLGSALL